MRGGYSNQRSLREGRLRNCERILETPPAVDPTKGIKVMTPDARRHRRGTDRNDNLLGSFGARHAGRPRRQRHHLGQPQAHRRAAAASTASTPAPATTPSTARRAAARPTSTAATATTTCRAAARPPPTTSPAAPGSDAIRLTGHGFNEVDAGSGDDIVYAYYKDRAVIDCGAGDDLVKIGHNRKVRTRGCEKVSRRYKK